MSGKTPLVFIPHGVKMMAYIQPVLQNPMRDWAKMLKNDDWVFQQDGDLAHTNSELDEKGVSEVPTKGIVATLKSGPESYGLESYLERKVARINHVNVDALKSAIQECDKMSHGLHFRLHQGILWLSGDH